MLGVQHDALIPGQPAYLGQVGMRGSDGAGKDGLALTQQGLHSVLHEIDPQFSPSGYRNPFTLVWMDQTEDCPTM